MATQRQTSSAAKLKDNRHERLGINERVGLIRLIDEGLWPRGSNSPIVADLFNNLWELVDSTASGSKINRLNPELTQQGFHAFELNARTGENLGRLNMLYLKKPIPCYYLVYVEVSPLFRKRGLGHQILDHLRRFLIEKSAVGILDNIIPPDDPSYSIYFKNEWEPIERVVGSAITDPRDNYMIYIPPALRDRDLKEPVAKLLHHLKRKRPVIDMRENEEMVQRTISEFKDLYAALLTYFEAELAEDDPPPFMRFMFSRFATQLSSFQNRIGELIGYTGGESIEQIDLAPQVAALAFQPYAPADLAHNRFALWGERPLCRQFMEIAGDQPALFIESLPDWERPCVRAWQLDKTADRASELTIGNLLELGFDPSQFKTVSMGGIDYVLERVPLRKIQEIEDKQRIIDQLGGALAGARPCGAAVKPNPPIMVVQDRGNAYVLRHSIEAIHWEEALAQVQRNPTLRNLNESMGLDKLILGTVRRANQMLTSRLENTQTASADLLSWHISWNFEPNEPRLFIDFSGSSLESVWIV